MVAAVERDLDRPLDVGIAAFRSAELRKRQRPEREVAGVDEGLDLLDDLFGVARRRQDAAQLLELDLEPVDLGPELRELALRGASLFDLFFEVGDLRLVGMDLLVDRRHQLIVNQRENDDRHHESDAGSPVPRLV